MGCSWASPPPWGTTALSWSVLRAAGESQFWCPEHLLPLFSTDLCVCRAAFLTCSHSSLQLQLLLHSLIPLPALLPLPSLLTSYLRGAATVTSGLELALSDIGTGAGSFLESQKQPKPCHANPKQMAKV